jgi:hypothetical protein
MVLMVFVTLHPAVLRFHDSAEAVGNTGTEMKNKAQDHGSVQHREDADQSNHQDAGERHRR